MIKLLRCILLLLVICMFLPGCKPSEETVLTGEYLLTEDGSHVFLYQLGWETDAYYLQNASGNAALFEGLQSGDAVEIHVLEFLSESDRLTAKVTEIVKINSKST